MEDSTFSVVDSRLLEKVDGLFACNAGNYVDLPQLVVVGHQSSGKSSVLAGVTGLPFPRDSSLCTRFATQIIFRRTKSTGINAFIVPAKGSSDEHIEKIKQWGHRGSGSLNATLFRKIMAEAIEAMNVGPSESGPRPAFSKDVLVLEITGPSQEHFSVIDVPGTFKRTTQGQTTKDDITLVDDMVRTYMQNPRSVMLTVVPCNTDIATQEVVQMAEDLDPEGDRTLGILTKPDLVDKGAEKDVLDLVEDRRHKLKLGWHLLRNPGQADACDTPAARSALEEAFFTNQIPWNDLDKDKVGVQSLRRRLQGILATHIRREFPKVKLEIRHRLQATNTKLLSLGPKRQSHSEQMQFLIDIAIHFQDVASAAARADYGLGTFFEKDKNLRLATAAVNRGAVFADAMAEWGHKFNFRACDDVDDISEEDFSQISIEDEEVVTVRLVPDHLDLIGMLEENATVPKPKEGDILAWLRSVYMDSRGFELGTFASSILAVTMQKQAQKWRALAYGYIHDVISLVHSFVLALLDHVVPSRYVQEGLRSLLADDLQSRYRAAMAQTTFLLDVELDGAPATYNHYFNETLGKSRQERLQKLLSDRSFPDDEHGAVIRLEDIVQSHPMSNEDHIIYEIHDILKSYYKLARKRFVDNMRKQVADYFLLIGPNTPLKLFSSRFVAGLSPAKLEEVAGEEFGTKRQRAELEKDIVLLEKGMAIL